MNYHFGRFSVLNKILMIYSMLVKMRKITLSYIANRNVIQPHGRQLSVHIFYPMISLLSIPWEEISHPQTLRKSIGTRKFIMVGLMICKSQKNLIIKRNLVILVHPYNGTIFVLLKGLCIFIDMESSFDLFLSAKKV